MYWKECYLLCLCWAMNYNFKAGRQWNAYKFLCGRWWTRSSRVSRSNNIDQRTAACPEQVNKKDQGNKFWKTFVLWVYMHGRTSTRQKLGLEAARIDPRVRRDRGSLKKTRCAVLGSQLMMLRGWGGRWWQESPGLEERFSWSPFTGKGSAPLRFASRISLKLEW